MYIYFSFAGHIYSLINTRYILHFVIQLVASWQEHNLNVNNPYSPSRGRPHVRVPNFEAFNFIYINCTCSQTVRSYQLLSYLACYNPHLTDNPLDCIHQPLDLRSSTFLVLFVFLVQKWRRSRGLIINKYLKSTILRNALNILAVLWKPCGIMSTNATWPTPVCVHRVPCLVPMDWRWFVKFPNH